MVGKAAFKTLKAQLKVTNGNWNGQATWPNSVVLHMLQCVTCSAWQTLNAYDIDVMGYKVCFFTLKEIVDGDVNENEKKSRGFSQDDDEEDDEDDDIPGKE